MTDNTYETLDLTDTAPIYRTVPTAKAESDAAIFNRLLPLRQSGLAAQVPKDVLPNTDARGNRPVPHDGTGSPDRAAAADDVVLTPTGRYTGAEFAMPGAVSTVPLGDQVFRPADDVAGDSDARGLTDRPLVDDTGLSADYPARETDDASNDEELR
jgi:hypothetical protein